jgi:hypothetical protein
MRHYKNINQGSSVLAYEYGNEWITIEYVTGNLHTYKYADAGRSHVESMKKYADKGKGLDSYISQHHLRRKSQQKEITVFMV